MHQQLMVEKGNAFSDVSPLIQIKEAIQKLKVGHFSPFSHQLTLV
jgi:hypothetical protein